MFPCGPGQRGPTGGTGAWRSKARSGAGTRLAQGLQGGTQPPAWRCWSPSDAGGSPCGPSSPCPGIRAPEACGRFPHARRPVLLGPRCVGLSDTVGTVQEGLAQPQRGHVLLGRGQEHVGHRPQWAQVSSLGLLRGGRPPRPTCPRPVRPGVPPLFYGEQAGCTKWAWGTGLWATGKNFQPRA